MATIDSLDIQIAVSAQKANQAIDSLIKNLGNIATALKIDASGLEKIGKSLNLSGISKSVKSANAEMQKISKSAAEAAKEFENKFKDISVEVDFSRPEAELQKFQKQAQTAKNALSRIMASSSADKQIGSIERYSISLAQADNAVKLLKNHLAEMQTVKLDVDAEEIKNADNLIEQMRSHIRQQMLGMRIENPINLPSLSDEDLEIFMRLRSEMQQVSQAAENMGEKFEQNLSPLSKRQFNEGALKAAYGEIAEGLENWTQAAQKFGKNYGMIFNQSSSETNKLKDGINEVNKAAKNTAGLKSVGNVAKEASKSFSNLSKNGLKASNSLRKMKTSVKELARALLPLLGIRELIKFGKESVESVTDYVEAFNYYNVAFEKIADEWNQDFEKYGYENAESYANSFVDRMNETLGKLSGVQVNLETGLLEETGTRNLGLNIQQITQYASRLASVTNSVGQTGEVSLAAARSFSKLAGDISSLFNIDYGSVAQNLQSGLIGQSRALYKYGIDITNATLQTYAYELGLEKAVSQMTQAEKMQLRMIAILDQSKVSWGDLANTINSPSNMLRQFTNNVKELSTVIGQLFIPILQKVMPVINGVVIALKRLVVSIAQLLGVKIDFDSFGQGYSDLSDGADDLSDSLGGVAASAKKAKAGLRAFDELKVINMPDTSGAGAGAGGGEGIDLTDQILKATEEYERAWNEAFSNMENTAQKWADKIEKALGPVKKIFQDFAIGDFFQAGKDTSALVAGIFNFFADAIDKVNWHGIGRKIGDFLAGVDWFAILKSVGNLIWQALKAAFELWKGSFEKAPIETIFLTILSLPVITGFASKLIAMIINPFKNIISILAPIIEAISNLILGLSTPFLIIASVISGLGYVFATNEEIREGFFQSVSAIIEGLKPALDFIINTLLPDLSAGWDRLKEILTPFAEFLNDVFVSAWQDMINPALSYIGETVLPKLTEAFENLWNNVLVPLGSFLADVLQPIIQIVSDILKMLWENVVVPLADAIGGVLSKAFEGLCEIFKRAVIPIVNTAIEVFRFLWDNVLSPIVDFLWGVLKPAFETVFGAIGDIVGGILDVFSGIIEFIVGIFTLDWRKAWDGVVGIFSGIAGTIGNIVSGVIDGFGKIIKKITGIFDASETAASSVGDLADALKQTSQSTGSIKGIEVVAGISVKAPGYASGQVIPRTMKRHLAILGDNNKETEIVSPLSTIRKAVSQELYSSKSVFGSMNGGWSGRDIFQPSINNEYGSERSGFSDVILETKKQNQLLQQQNALLEQILKKPNLTGKEMYEAIKPEYQSDATRRYGNSAAFDPVWG